MTIPASRGDVTPFKHDGVIDVVTDDEDLIRRVQSGDVAAFETLAERYQPACLRFAWRQLGQREDAEEAVQDALLRAFRALQRGRLPYHFRPWLMRIVVNRCRSMLARKARRRRLFESWVSWREQKTATPPEVDDGIDPRLRSALDSLRPALREALLLKHVEDLSYADMSTITGVRISALKMRVKRATAQLIHVLEEDG